MVLRQYKDKQFVCGHNILTESVFVNQLSSNAGISAGGTVWGYDDKLQFHERYFGKLTLSKATVT